MGEEELLGARVAVVQQPGDEAELLTREAISMEQGNDQFLGLIRKWLQTGTDPPPLELKIAPYELKKLVKEMENMRVEDDVLFINKPSGWSELKEGGWKVVAPFSLRSVIYRNAHLIPQAGHAGVRTTLLRACQRFYWPGMSGEIRRLVSACREGSCA